MNPKVLAAVIGAVVIGSVVTLIVVISKNRDPKDYGAVLVELRPKADDPDSIVSASHGGYLFKHNCVSCHGWRGEGDGPADKYLWRRPRNLSDGSYMNSRSDEILKDVIHNGGQKSAAQLSRLMPAWNTTFTAYQQADILAYVKQLYPTIDGLAPDIAGDWVRFESVLSDDRLAQVKSKSGSEPAEDDRHIAFYAVWSTKTGRPRREDGVAPQPGAAGLAGYAAFARMQVGDQWVSIGMAIDSQGQKVHRVAVFERVVLLTGATRDEASVDNFLKEFQSAGEDIGSKNPSPISGRDALCTDMASVAKRLYWRIRMGIEQDTTDWDDITAGKRANENHPGRAIWDRMECAKCHGSTGRSKGPGVGAREPLPANLANPVYMRPLSDKYITDVLTAGGPAMKISGVMPSFETSMTADEIKTLVEYVRSMSEGK